jgi:SsrA-binding protein
MSLISNKKVSLRYAILETFQAGLELSGSEVKALRKKQGSLDGSRVIIRGGEAFLVGMHIPPYQPTNNPTGNDPDRTRKLLLSKAEIQELGAAEARKGLTVVPIEVYNSGRYLKVRIAVVRGKGKSDKREDLKLKDAKRDMDRALKRRTK